MCSSDLVDWCAVLKLASGRRILGELFNISGTLTKNQSDNAIEFARQEGRRQIGTHIIAKTLEYCPEKFTQMYNELKSDIAERQAIRERIIKRENKDEKLF